MPRFLFVVLVLIAMPAVADWNQYSDNPLIAFGLLDPDAEMEFPDEVYITEDEIERFAAAYVDVTVASNRATARMVLDQEIKRRVLIELTQEITEVLLTAEIDVHRYRILDSVVNMEPRIFDDMVRHAQNQRAEKLHLMQLPESFQDYKELLDGVVSYEVTREMYQSAYDRLKPNQRSGGSRSQGGMVPGIFQ